MSIRIRPFAIALALIALMIVASVDAREIKGVVIDANTNQPLADFEFGAILMPEDSENFQRSHAQLTTDSNGEFTVDFPETGNMYMQWSARTPEKSYLLNWDQLERSRQMVSIKPDTTTLEFKLPLMETRAINGVVRDEEGAPVQGASVAYMSRGAAIMANTDSEGRFELNGVPKNDEFSLVCSKTRSSMITGKSVVKGGCCVTVSPDLSNLEIEMKKTIDIKGTLVDEKGNPLANASLSAMPDLGGAPIYTMARRANSAADGSFTMNGMLADTKYTFAWRGNDVNEGSQNVMVCESDEPLQLSARRFEDNWQAKGNIAVHEDTKCQKLSGYCLDGDDNILAADEGAQEIKVISPEDKLLATWKPGFAPQVIAHREDGVTFVAGSGKIASFDKDGQLLNQGVIPGNYSSGIGASGKDVFVAVRKGTGFSVFRVSEGLAGEPTLVAKGLRGCCGQLDIDARGGDFYVAANCDFKVFRFDRDGNKVGEFGKRSSGDDEEGFKGCCEPKNVTFDNQGNIYTAESGECCVKRFDSEGNFQKLLGYVEGIRGCVRVSIAINKAGDKIYMLDTNRNIIRVLTPEKKADPETADESETNETETADAA